MNPPTRAGAITAFATALVLVIALVLTVRLLAPTHHRPPHAARPAADATQEHDPTTPRLTDLEVTMLGDYLAHAATTTTAPPAPEPVTIPARGPIDPTTPTPLDNPDGFLACVRNRESGGIYTIYNSGGSGAAGAYQFMPATWDSTAAHAGRPDLVGVDPATASPADQDAMAQELYAWQGTAPWGGGC